MNALFDICYLIYHCYIVVVFRVILSQHIESESKMKTTNKAQTTTALDLFNKLVATATTQNKSKNEVCEINGVQYFRSKYSQRWFAESDRCGAKHNYSKADIKIWNQIYTALSPLKKVADELIKNNQQDKADEVFTAEHKALWHAKDTDTSLYANTGGLTDAELNALKI